MRILVTGARGMLGRTLLRRLPASGHAPIATDRAQVDLSDAAAVDALMAEQRPDVVVHAAACTAVDRCEAETDPAWRDNALATAAVARACHRRGARLIAISTDYVFRGDLDRPYHEWDETGPRTVYGQSKLAAERAVAAHCADHTILRVAWLYGPGGPSFVHTMLRLGTQAGPALQVVDDQVGNPTSTDAVADLVAALIARPLPGVVHATCEGDCSWHGFASAIFALRGIARGVAACTTAAFPRPAPRPANSRLEKRALRLAGFPLMPHWHETLERFLREHPDA